MKIMITGWNISK